MAASIGKSILKSELKSKSKDLQKEINKAAKPSGPRLREGTGVGDKVEGCCNRCCAATCRISPWKQVLCWACVALTITTVVVWIGGAFLVGPAKKNTAKNECGTSITIPLVNVDGYIFFLSSSGIFVIIMIVASCICCCSGGCVCSSRMPIGCKICGALGLLLGSAATAVFVSWIGLGTYLVLKLHSADTICRNTIAYLALLYLYLVVLVIVGVVFVAWYCKDFRKSESDGNRWSRKSRKNKNGDSS